MAKTVNVHEAKTHLSRLLVDVSMGEEIVIMRGSTPAARLVPVEGAPPRELGFMPLGISDEALFAPLPEDELALWEGR